MKTIGVFFGSRAPEHDISIITGQLIVAGLKDIGLDVVPIYISKKGRWYIGKQLDSILFFRLPNKEDKLTKMKEYSLDMEASSGKMVFRAKGLWPKKVEIDIAFPALHGINGEDGTIQGVFELVNIPYVGCDVAASAIAMDKVLTKMLYKANDIPTVPFVYFKRSDWEKNKADWLSKIAGELSWPLMVKPARLGSSIGMAKVKDSSELEFAVEVALHYDDKVLVENCVEQLMDVTCAVLGNDEPVASLLQESLFEDDIFSYEDKYLRDGGAQTGKSKSNIVIPARLPAETTREIQAMSKRIYRLTGCSGISRVDYLYDKADQKIYANEINAMPGTIYHHLWKKSGIGLPELLRRLIDLAEEKFAARRKLTMTFESDILSRAGEGASKVKLKAE